MSVNKMLKFMSYYFKALFYRVGAWQNIVYAVDKNRYFVV